MEMIVEMSRFGHGTRFETETDGTKPKVSVLVTEFLDEDRTDRFWFQEIHRFWNRL
jgi:hypothetical protein